MRPDRRLLAVALLLSPLPAVAQDDGEGGFTPLVEGTDPGQFQLVGIGPDDITIGEGGVIALAGSPRGYFATKDEYKDYVLKFEWMYERPDDLSDDASFDGNSGLLLHIQGEPKVWPKCTEAQLKFGDFGHVFAIQGASFDSSVGPAELRSAQEEARRPVGKWNSQEVVCEGGAISCTVNGVLIDEGTGADPSSGRIGWQSEGRPIRFRNLMIKVAE